MRQDARQYAPRFYWSAGLAPRRVGYALVSDVGAGELTALPRGSRARPSTSWARQSHLSRLWGEDERAAAVRKGDRLARGRVHLDVVDDDIR